MIELLFDIVIDDKIREILYFVFTTINKISRALIDVVIVKW